MPNDLHRLLSRGLAIALAVASPYAAAAETDLAACYGETLDIVFAAGVDRDGDTVPLTRMSLPSPNAWLVTDAETGELLNKLPCQTEPIPISDATMMGIDPRLGHVEIPAGESLGARVRMITFGRATESGVRDRSEGEFEFLPREGRQDSGGFTRIAGTHTDAIGGIWLFPEDYLSAFGNRIRLGCALVCSVWYGFDQDRRLWVSYRFRVDDPSQQPDWIAIDQSVRALVLQWIEEN